MARDNVFAHEEEDLGTAMQKLEIPYNELHLDPLHIGSVFNELKELVDVQEFDDPNHIKYVDSSNVAKPFLNSSNSPSTVTKGGFNVPKQSRNKRGRPKRRYFNNAPYDFDSKVKITDKNCSHCCTRKSPLWREGPNGQGTLCNACGLRYRKGLLFPEYRPASSPGFKPNVHSNFYRKVMEIRKVKNSPPNKL